MHAKKKKIGMSIKRRHTSGCFHHRNDSCLDLTTESQHCVGDGPLKPRHDTITGSFGFQQLRQPCPHQLHRHGALQLSAAYWAEWTTKQSVQLPPRPGIFLWM